MTFVDYFKWPTFIIGFALAIHDISGMQNIIDSFAQLGLTELGQQIIRPQSEYSSLYFYLLAECSL